MGDLLSYSNYGQGNYGTDDTPALGGSVPTAPVVTGTPAPDYAAGVATRESGGIPAAENPYYPAAKGGPLGPHQFLASTWGDFAKANPQYFAGMTPDQVLAARSDPALSATATNWYAKQNAHVLQKAGIVPTPGNLAVAHALGGFGASSALKYPDDAPLSKVFQETQPKMADTILAMNPQYKSMTVGQLKAKYAGMDTGQYAPAPTKTAAAVPPVTPTAPTSSATAATAVAQADRYAQALAMNNQYAQLQRLALVSKMMQPAQNQVANPYANSVTPWAQPLQPSNPLATVAQYAQLGAVRDGNPLTGV